MKNKTMQDMPKNQKKLLDKYTKLFLDAGYPAICRIAVAPYSIGADTLFVYLFFKNPASVPDKLEDLIYELGYQRLNGNNIGILAGIEFPDDAKPYDAITVWEEAA